MAARKGRTLRLARRQRRDPIGAVVDAPYELYTTPLGRAVVGRAQDMLEEVPAGSVDLVMTSPPFALLRE